MLALAAQKDPETIHEAIKNEHKNSEDKEADASSNAVDQMLVSLYEVSKETGKMGKNMQLHLKNNAMLLKQMIRSPEDKTRS